MPVAPLVFLAAGFAVAGLYLMARAIVGRQATRERRRLSSLGTVESHRLVRPHDGD